ncbi:N-acetylmuramoyl-L-alanine amidase [Paenibacillus sp. GCM10027627]|uniref:N-acetylmuramoyl-L-alanine amidase n=1 Tax=unclassified Paenibacillus TaxID=185978 RepID=UPI003641CEC8
MDNYNVSHIPKTTPNNRRPAHPLNATTITLHNTGNPKSTARNERDWLTNSSNNRTASYHIVIDEHEAIECLPLNENAWAAGDGASGPGNRASIHIELCESGNYAKTLDNAVDLVAKLLRERSWGVDRLRRHYDWTRKLCPRLMYDSGSWAGWQLFIKRVEDKLNDKGVHIKVNGELIKARGELRDGVTWLPLRAVAEALGTEVSWESHHKTVHLTHLN